MEMQLEAVQIPVADIDRSRDFYARIVGFALDLDLVAPGGMRVVQLTPPGSGCSIHLVEGEHPNPGLTLVVDDVRAVRADLAARGAPVGDVVHFENGEQKPGYSDEPWSSMVFFADPDGNRWIIQERPT
ncbi:VOC family protein [Spongisporangium articulatum]|uniref:VOC family protein n=1 Tax=Spongisporangium articulatum TaxID=3362603 RepID=A0ABW8AKT9_9ACTN